MVKTSAERMWLNALSARTISSFTPPAQILLNADGGLQ
jgi:hypothetical protein